MRALSTGETCSELRGTLPVSVMAAVESFVMPVMLDIPAESDFMPDILDESDFMPDILDESDIIEFVVVIAAVLSPC